MNIGDRHGQPYKAGDFVEERGGDVRGLVVGPGDYAGEWRILRSDGREVICLGENLAHAQRTAEPAMPEPLWPLRMSFREWMN